MEYSGTVRVTSAELIRINPDVQVVADADEPVFFARGTYWLFHDGAWYRSGSLRGTWIQVAKPPVPVVQIDQPYAYTRYRRDRAASAETVEPAQPQAQPMHQPQRRKVFDFEP